MVVSLQTLRERTTQATVARGVALEAQLLRLERGPSLSRRDLVALQDALGFALAYPQSAAEHRLVERVAEALMAHCKVLSEARRRRLQSSGLPTSEMSYCYSFGVARQLLARGAALEIDWESLDDEAPLTDLLSLLVTPGESIGLEDISMSLSQWLSACRPTRAPSDLAFLVELLESAPLSPAQRVHLFERCELPLRLSLMAPHSARLAARGRPARLSTFRAFRRERFALQPRIDRPLERPASKLSSAQGRAMVERWLYALCTRELEIYPLIYAEPRDVHVVPLGRGLEVVLVGVQPAWRSPLEVLHFFGVQRNSVPIAYGPTAVFAGCCELGINVFEPFRGVEMREIYAELLRALRHVLDIEYFFLTPYGMGEGNDEAIRSGAFWFYRKLGFLPDCAEVETIARTEEARMQREPGHRSNLRTLRRLSHTGVYLDLSAGARRPVDFGALGVAQSRLVAERFGGDRVAAAREGARVARASCELTAPPAGSEAHAPFSAMTALFALLAPQLETWSRRDRQALARFVKAKCARSEVGAAARSKQQRRFVEALHDAARRERQRMDAEEK